MMPHFWVYLLPLGEHSILRMLNTTRVAAEHRLPHTFNWQGWRKHPFCGLKRYFQAQLSFLLAVSGRCCITANLPAVVQDSYIFIKRVSRCDILGFHFPQFVGKFPRMKCTLAENSTKSVRTSPTNSFSIILTSYAFKFRISNILMSDSFRQSKFPSEPFAKCVCLLLSFEI